ncbi:hypothetical protein [Thalassobacillus hwangdonensis]|uniref:Spore coat protein n=1 Tax=Thalassobacillus hwangdonensis TaxID=546108 RepID=A0ABW3L059_9BACI
MDYRFAQQGMPNGNMQMPQMQQMPQTGQMPQMPQMQQMPQAGQQMPSMQMPQMNQMQNASNKDKYDHCKKHMNYYMIIVMNDGQQYEGIIDDVDSEGVTMLEPMGDQEDNDREDERIYGWGYPGWGYPRRFRRFYRRRFPFYGIGGFYFPFFW